MYTTAKTKLCMTKHINKYFQTFEDSPSEVFLFFEVYSYYDNINVFVKSYLTYLILNSL